MTSILATRWSLIKKIVIFSIVSPWKCFQSTPDEMPINGKTIYIDGDSLTCLQLCSVLGEVDLLKRQKFPPLASFNSWCLVSFSKFWLGCLFSVSGLMNPLIRMFFLFTLKMTVKKTLSEFRRTHHDNWQEHRQCFTDDQLLVLTDLLVSPCYYA